MGKGFGRPSPAMIVAMIALVLALTGGAFAAGKKIGSNKIKANAIKTAKIADGAVTGVKIADGAITQAQIAPGTIAEGVIPDNGVTTNKIADGAVTREKIADGAISAEKIGLGQVGRDNLGGGAVGPAELDPTERSEAFRTTQGSQLSMPGGSESGVIQTTLPSGDFVFTVSAELGNSTASANFVSCNLLDANNPVATSGTALTASATFQQTISLTGISDGGVVRLRCTPSLNAAVRNVVFTATRAGFVETLSSTR